MFLKFFFVNDWTNLFNVFSEPPLALYRESSQCNNPSLYEKENDKTILKSRRLWERVNAQMDFFEKKVTFEMDLTNWTIWYHKHTYFIVWPLACICRHFAGAQNFMVFNTLMGGRLKRICDGMVGALCMRQFLPWPSPLKTLVIASNVTRVPGPKTNPTKVL